MSLLSLRKIEISEERYRADMELHDRFQNFSSEILKLSLSGIAVIGFIISLIGSAESMPSKPLLIKYGFVDIVAATVVFFAVSVALALTHRFMASDGMYHHLRAIKHLIIKEHLDQYPDLKEVDVKDLYIRLDKLALTDELARNRKFTLSEYFLYMSAFFLVVAATSLGISSVLFLKSILQG